MVATMLVSSVLIPGASTVRASATSHSFNTATGALNVDYAGYLSKHDVVFNSPVTTPKSGLTVGNGRVGAMVWNTAGGLTMQVSGVDASEEGFASQGLVNLYTSPGLDTSYSAYQQRLSLYDGLVTTKYDTNRTVTILGSPSSEVIGIHVEDSRTGVASVSLDLSLWDVSTFGGGDVPDIATWRTVSTFVDPTVVGFSRGQTDANNFGYTLAATVEGASFTTQSVDARKVRLNITPSSSYTIWIASASRLNAPSHNSVNQAKSALVSVKNTGYTTTLANYKSWWHAFWNRSFVQYSNASGDADYLESFYYLSTYMIAAGGFGNYPFHFINGVFSAVNDDDSTKWSNAYWYWNQRDVYHSFLASNHAEIVNTFNNLYSRNFAALKSYTMTRYGIDGIWVPETMGWNASPAGTIGSDYTQDILSTAAEAALNMYAQYKYTNDASLFAQHGLSLHERGGQVLRGQALFQQRHRKYFMASSNVHEQHWDVQNAITDLAAVRSLFPVTIQAAQSLGVDSALRAQWQNVLTNLVAYPVDPSDSTKYFPIRRRCRKTATTRTSSSSWPGPTASPASAPLTSRWSSTITPADRTRTAGTTCGSRPDPGGAARAWQRGLPGHEDDAAKVSGLSQRAHDEHERRVRVHRRAPDRHERIVAAKLQRQDQGVPALPTDATFNGKFTLLASGGFLVSSEKESNEIKYVGVKSLYGNQLTVVNPWGTQQVQVRRVPDNTILLTSSSSELTLATAANATYIVERTAKPPGNYTYEALTGTANNTVKTVTYNGVPKSLGSAAPYLGPKPTFYPNSGFGGTGVSLEPGVYSISQMAAAGIANDAISSIKVPSGITVVAYGDGDFTGPSWTLTADNSNLASIGADNTISSFKITAPQFAAAFYRDGDPDDTDATSPAGCGATIFH